MGRKTVCIYLSENIIKEVENIWKEESRKLIEKGRVISKSEIYERIIMLGIKAKKAGYLV